MAESSPTRIRFRGMLAYVLPAGLLAAGVGVWPTWRLAGAAGLAAKGVAGLIVLAAGCVSAWAVLWAWRHGPAWTAWAFVLAGLFRMASCLAMAGGAWLAFGLSPRVLFLWTAVFYIVMLLGESLWLARALRRGSARRVSGDGSTVC